MIQNCITEILDQYDLIDGTLIDKKKVDYAFSIGLFLIDFSKFEHHLNLSLAELISDRAHDKGYLIIGQLSIFSKLELYKKLLSQYVLLCSKRKDYHIDKLNHFIRNARLIIEFRNSIAHCNWYGLKEKGMVRVKIEQSMDDGLITFKNKQIYPRTIKSYLSKIELALEQLTCLDLSELNI